MVAKVENCIESIFTSLFVKVAEFCLRLIDEI